jgi:starch phosphorylase
MATMQIPAMGYGLRYEYGMFKQAIKDGWRSSSATTGCAARPVGDPRALHDKVEVKLNCSFEMRDGNLHVIQGLPSTLIGIPFDRPIVGYGARRSTRCACGRRRPPNYFD